MQASAIARGESKPSLEFPASSPLMCSRPTLELLMAKRTLTGRSRLRGSLFSSPRVTSRTRLRSPERSLLDGDPMASMRSGRLSPSPELGPIWWKGLVKRNPHLHLGDAVNQVGISPFRFLDDLDRREALQDLLPQDHQLHLRQPVADAAMDAEPERQMLTGPRAIDDKAIRLLDLFGIAVAGDIPHRDLVTLADALPVQLCVA